MFALRCAGMLMLCVFTAAAAQPLAKGTPAPKPSAAAAARPDEIFSRRAMRRARLLIQMRLLELHEEHLECIRQAILRRLPPELRPQGSLGPGVKQTGAAHDSAKGSTSESEDCAWKAKPPRPHRRTA